MRRVAVVLTVAFLVSCTTSKSPQPSAVPPAAAVPNPAPNATSAPMPSPDSLTRPEIVRLERVVFVNHVKNVRVGNFMGHYALACNTELDSCVSPTPGTDYFVFNKTSKWRFPGAKDDISLEWIQGWTVTYQKVESIALVPANGGDPNNVGMYWLVRWDKE